MSALFTAKAQMIITFNSGYTTLSPVTLNLDSDKYAIGRANTEVEYGHGTEKAQRSALQKEVVADPNNEVSILNRHPELMDLPSVYITNHNVHGEKIVFAPYLIGISRDIGVLEYNTTARQYRLTSNGPSTKIFRDDFKINKGDKLFLPNNCKLRDGNLVFEIIIRC